MYNVFIWDSDIEPKSKLNKNHFIIYWNLQKNKPRKNSLFILRFAEKHAEELKQQFLKWTYLFIKENIKINKINYKKFLINGLNLMWMSPIATKNIPKNSSSIENAIRLLAYQK